MHQLNAITLVYTRDDQFGNRYFYPPDSVDAARLERFLETYYAVHVWPKFGTQYRMKWIANGAEPELGRHMIIDLNFQVRAYAGKRYVSISIHGYTYAAPNAQ